MEMNIPQNLKYTKDHEWALIEGNIAKIGITEHAVHQLGDIVFVELPEVGRTLNAHETFGVVESVKAVSDLYAPITGKVIERNDALINDPSLINKDPYSDGWMLKIEIANTDDVKALLDNTAYSKLV